MSIQSHDEGCDTRAIVHSLEGDLYLLELQCGGHSDYVRERFNRRPKCFASFAEAKVCARKRGVKRISMGFSSPYEEMIGLTCR